MFLSNPPAPLLSYEVIDGEWVWGGSLATKSDKTDADTASAWIRFAWEGVTQAEPESIAANIQSIALVADGEVEIGINGLKRQKAVSYVPDLKIRLVPAGSHRAALAAQSYRSVIERGGWQAPELAPARAFHLGLERAIHSAVHSREDANRAMRLSNVAFEKDGSDVLMLATDGHRLTLHRLVGFAKLVSRFPKADAIIPVTELKNLLPKLKAGRDFQLDLSGHEGPSHVYNYGFKGSYGPALVDAYNGGVIIDGERYDVPVVKHEFLTWRNVFPRPEWTVTIDSGELLSVVSELHAKWSEAIKARPKRSGKKEPSGRLVFEGKSVHLEITPDLPGTPETVSADLSSSGLTQNRPVRFYMNFRYLKDALRLLSGPVLLAGESDGSKSIDGNTYLVKPISFLDASGPTEILIMPMYPPR